MIFLDQAVSLRFDWLFCFEELIPLLVGERITVEQLQLAAEVVDQIRFADDRYIVVSPVSAITQATQHQLVAL